MMKVHTEVEVDIVSHNGWVPEFSAREQGYPRLHMHDTGNGTTMISVRTNSGRKYFEVESTELAKAASIIVSAQELSDRE